MKRFRKQVRVITFNILFRVQIIRSAMTMNTVADLYPTSQPFVLGLQVAFWRKKH